MERSGFPETPNPNLERKTDGMCYRCFWNGTKWISQNAQPKFRLVLPLFREWNEVDFPKRPTQIQGRIPVVSGMERSGFPETPNPNSGSYSRCFGNGTKWISRNAQVQAHMKTIPSLFRKIRCAQ